MDLFTVEIVNCDVDICQEEQEAENDFITEVKDLQAMPFEDDAIHKCGEIIFSLKRNLFFLCTFCNTNFTQIEDFVTHLSDMHMNILGNMNMVEDCTKTKETLLIDSMDDFIQVDINKKLDMESLFEKCECASEIDIENNSKETCINLNEGEQIETGNKENVQKSEDTLEPFLEGQSTNVDNPKPVKNVVFECKYCGHKFKKKFFLLEHERIHTGEKPFRCAKCDKRFRLKKSLKKHMPTHIKPHQCDVCEAAFTTPGGLSKHLKSHRDIKPYKCEYCQARFVLDEERIQHERIHTKEKPFQCDLCGKCYRTKRLLKHHTKIVHSEKRPHKCSQCHLAFIYRTYLNLHILRAHTDYRPFECEICGKGFARDLDRKMHEKIHSEERPFQCSECGLLTKTKGGLTEHLKIHSKIRPFKCSVCDKGFLNATALKSHFIIHTDEKPYECEICKNKFARRNQVVRHMKVHIKQE